MAAEHDEAVARFVECMAMALADRGFPRMPARVLTALMSAQEGALSAGEVGQRLGVSPAAVSGAVRFLVQMGLVVREPVPGERRDRYRVPDDTWYQASIAKNESLTRIAELADEGADAVGGPDTPAGRRLTEMGEFFRFVHAETAEVVRRWRDSRVPDGAPTRSGAGGEGSDPRLRDGRTAEVAVIVEPVENALPVPSASSSGRTAAPSSEPPARTTPRLPSRSRPDSSATTSPRSRPA